MKALSKNSHKKYLHNRFKIKTAEKWFVYSPKLFSFFRNKDEEEKLYKDRLKRKNIKAISFADILRDVYDELNYYGYDFPRQYIFLLKKMGYVNNE